MNFYSISFAHIGGKLYPWASGFGPLQEMPFFDGISHVFRERRYRSWELSPMLPGMEIDPGGKSWSDMIGCGVGSYINFVSEKIICDLDEQSIPILRATEMPISRILAKALRKIQPPRYYVLEAIPCIEPSWDAMGILLDENQKPILPSFPAPFPEMKYRLASWNGLDLFSRSAGVATTTLFCTERVKDLAEQKGWTNVKFVPLEMVD